MRLSCLFSLAFLAACDSTSTVTHVPPTVEIVQPPCEHPAPLLGNPAVSAYIVMYRDGVDATLETERLATKYGFQPRYVFTHGTGGFSAALTSQVLAEIRCEATIDFTEFMTSFGPAGESLSRAPPNTRLKLAAPSCCGGHRFVNVLASRRSLSAFR